MDDSKQLLEAAARAAGGQDWKWWTSNSHRRLTFEEGRSTRDGSAMLAFGQGCGWPDISMAPGVQEFIERASPKAVLALIERIRVLEAAACDPHQTEGKHGHDLRSRCEGHDGSVAGQAQEVPDAPG